MKPRLTSAGVSRSSLALAAVAAAAAVTSLSACGGSGPSSEALAMARQRAAGHVHREERLRRVERELREARHDGTVVLTGARSPEAVASYAPPSQPRTVYAVPTSSGGECGGGVSVNSVTTCPFAENVRNAYYAEIGSGSGTVYAHSPVTGQDYSMYCTGSPHVCTGGNDAAVHFP